MLFNSYSFLLFFLPAALAAFYLALRFRQEAAPIVALLAASVVFYSVWQVPYLGILAGSIAWNFAIGQAICRFRTAGREREARALLAVGVAGDLLLLGYFKYRAFGLENLRALLGTTWEIPKVVLPLGISFYTFTQIAYLVDASRGHATDRSFTKYCLFVTYFPHLVAGPILHHKEMIPQFTWTNARRAAIVRNVYLGTLIFVLGLVKKVAVADPLSYFAKTGFDNAASLSFVDGWIASLAYTFQLYFDFSGYSDMAVGLGLMLQVRLPINFSAPYLASNIQQFWRRWHITLSNFLRDYLYIPLGGSRNGEVATMRNLLLTFLLGGLWHGAGWTFLVWGALHGCALVAHRLWQRTKIQVPSFAALAATFFFVHVAWVFFRAESMEQAHRVLRSMVRINQADLFQSRLFSIDALVEQYRIAGHIPVLSSEPYAIASVLFAIAVGVYFTIHDAHSVALRIRPGVIAGVGFALLGFFALLRLDRSAQFLYFNF